MGVYGALILILSCLCIFWKLCEVAFIEGKIEHSWDKITLTDLQYLFCGQLWARSHPGKLSITSWCTSRTARSGCRPHPLDLHNSPLSAGATRLSVLRRSITAVERHCFSRNRHFTLNFGLNLQNLVNDKVLLVQKSTRVSQEGVGWYCGEVRGLWSWLLGLNPGTCYLYGFRQVTSLLPQFSFVKNK